MRYLKLFIILLTLLVTVSCHKARPVLNESEILHSNEEQLTHVIIYDVFTPPVASRIYGYSNLASYEALRYADPKYSSLIAQIKGFDAPPAPEKGKSYNYTLAATKAFFTVAHKVTFSIDTLKRYEDKVFGLFKEALDDSTYNRSVAFGEKIGKLVLKRAATDNYPQTRGKPRYLGNNGHAQWRPTPPDYFDGVEYCWGTMHPFVINSSTQFPIPPPAPYSTEPNSDYVKQAQQVYQLNKHLTEEQKFIARFWDDNPFVVVHNGHMMFADKKITPGGHWIGSPRLPAGKTKASAVKNSPGLCADLDRAVRCIHLQLAGQI